MLMGLAVEVEQVSSDSFCFLKEMKLSRKRERMRAKVGDSRRIEKD